MSEPKGRPLMNITDLHRALCGYESLRAYMYNEWTPGLAIEALDAADELVENLAAMVGYRGADESTETKESE